MSEQAWAARMEDTERAAGNIDAANTWKGVGKKLAEEHFRCEPYRASMSVDACVARHTRVWKAARVAPGNAHANAFVGSACQSCAVGAAHRKGATPERWPDGSPIVRIARPALATLKEPVAAPVVVPLRRVDGPLVPAHQMERVKKERAAKAARVISKTKPRGEKGLPGHTVFVEHNGERKTLREWAAQLGITREALRARLRRLPLDEAMTRPSPASNAAAARRKLTLYLKPETMRAVDALSAGAQSMSRFIEDTARDFLANPPEHLEDDRASLSVHTFAMLHPDVLSALDALAQTTGVRPAALVRIALVRAAQNGAVT